MTRVELSFDEASELELDFQPQPEDVVIEMTIYVSSSHETSYFTALFTRAWNELRSVLPRTSTSQARLFIAKFDGNISLEVAMYEFLMW